MYYLLLGGYFIWRYSHVLETSYNVLYYCNQVRHVIFDQKKPSQENINEDWLLCEEDQGEIDYIIFEKS